LLSDTNNFLASLRTFDRYENTLRHWRHSLEKNRNNNRIIRGIHTEIMELRKSLRKMGYDLTISSFNIRFAGFRNDASLREGFKRAVLAITDKGVFVFTGSENHVNLRSYLEDRLIRSKLNIRQMHYLWYLRNQKTLTLSGSDTETKDDFEELQIFAKNNEYVFKQGVKNLG
jgi:hypothetical protein